MSTTTRYTVFLGGGNMGGDLDASDNPVVDGMWYVLDEEEGTCVSGPHETEGAALATAAAL